MRKSKPNRSELARRRKIRKFWADHPERRETQSNTQKQFWAERPERRVAKSREQKQFWADHPERREAQSKTTKRVMRSRKRRNINSENMKRLKAHAEFEARRIAGLRKAEAAPERKASRRATLAKTLAARGVRARAIRNSRKAQSSPQFRARASAQGKQRWAELRGASTAPPAKTPTRGRRRKNPTVDYRKAAILREGGLSWRQIAMKLDHENWAQGGNSRKAAADRIRVGVAQLGRNSSPAAPPLPGGEK
jgi:hypothetical protein